MRARGKHVWFVSACLLAMAILATTGCGSPAPEHVSSTVVVANNDLAEPAASVPAAVNAQPPAANVEPPEPVQPVVKDWLDPSQWRLLNANAQPQAGQQMVRMPNGLRIIAPPIDDTYQALLSHDFTDDFEVTMKLSVLGEDEIKSLGLTRPLPFGVEIGFRSTAATHFSGRMLPRSFQQSTIDLRLRGSNSVVGIYANGRPLLSFPRPDKSNGNVCLRLHENRAILVEKIEIREGLEPDIELAKVAEFMMGANGTPPGMMMMPPGMMPPGMMMGPGMMGPGMMPPNMMSSNMNGPNMMGPNMMGPNMTPNNMTRDAVSQNTLRQGGPVEGAMPPTGGEQLNAPLQAMLPAGTGGAAAEFSKTAVPPPTRTAPFMNYQDWYVPQSGNPNQDQTISGNVRFNARGNGMGIEKLSTAANFWILRQVAGQENFRYTLRVTIPALSGLGGFDRQTQLAAGIFPFENGTGISAILPGPFHHGAREVEFVATRIDGKVSITLDGQAVGESVSIPGTTIMGVYLGGDIRLSFYDIVSSDVSDKSANDNANRSPAEILAECEKSVLRIETESAAGKGAGTGFLVDGDGTFITSLYVLAGSTSAKATLIDGTVCDVLGTLATDPTRDIVIGKLGLTSPRTLKLASQLPRKGDSLTTLGAPLGPTISATGGVVSAIRSGAEIPTGFQEDRLSGTWLQFDAASVPGNCGGPILDSTGQVVAMSCLVSTQEAQNLNLGISSIDLNQLFQKSRLKAISPLAASMNLYAKGRRTALDAGVYDQALQEYVDQCRKEYAQLNRSLKDTIDSVTSVIRDFEKGLTQIPTSTDIDTDIVLMAGPQGKPMWFFRNADVKKRQIKRMQDHLRSLTKIRRQLTNVDDPESVLQLAMNFGAKLQMSVDKSVGFLTGAKVIEPLSKNELAILVDSTPCVIWLESTKGFDSGEQFLPQAVYIDGTKKVNVRNLSEPTVQLLRPVSEQDLRRVLAIAAPDDKAKEDQNAAENKGAADKQGKADNKARAENKNVDQPTAEPAEFRTWSDMSGKFKIEATLESFDGKIVKLKRRDGSIVSVPVDKLSEADRAWLAK